MKPLTDLTQQFSVTLSIKRAKVSKISRPMKISRVNNNVSNRAKRTSILENLRIYKYTRSIKWTSPEN